MLGAAVAPTYPLTVDGVVVTAGQPASAVTIDVYEDFLCPFCEHLRDPQRQRDRLAALNEGKLKVHYHSITILDARTTPPGYSTLAANAALCAVPAGIWPAVPPAACSPSQPAEGSAGLTAAQLSPIGTELGARPDFTQCVRAQQQRRRDHRRDHEGRRRTRPCRPTASSAHPTVAADGAKIDSQQHRLAARRPRGLSPARRARPGGVVYRWPGKGLWRSW